jgi:hypothetical protein
MFFPTKQSHEAWKTLKTGKVRVSRGLLQSLRSFAPVPAALVQAMTLSEYVKAL